MSRRILLVMNCLEREKYIAQIIKNELLKIDKNNVCQILYWNQGINWQRDVFEFKPDVLFTFPLTMVPLINRLMQVKLICGSTICCFTTEGFINLDRLEEDNNWLGYYDYPAELVDYHCFWGEKPSEYCWENLKKKNRVVSRDQIKVFGYPLWENEKFVDFPELKEVDVFLQREHLKYDNLVMVLSGFSEANKEIHDVLESKDAVNQCAIEDDKERQARAIIDVHNKQKQYRCEYYEMLIKLAEKNPCTLFMLKLHPKEIEWKRKGEGFDFSYFDGIENIIILEQEAPIGIYWKWIDVLIHYGSTAGLEAYVFGVGNIRIQSVNVRNRIFREDVYADRVFDSDMINEISEFIYCHEPKTENQVNDRYVADFFNFYSDKKYQPSQQIAEFLYTCESRTKSKRIYRKYVHHEYLDERFGKVLLKYLLRCVMDLNVKDFIHGCGVFFEFITTRK